VSDQKFEFAEEAFSETGDPRCPLVLLLDTSWSMNTETTAGRTRIQELSLGLGHLQQALMSDPVAQRRVEVLVVTFGGSVSVDPAGFQLARDWAPPHLVADGGTPMGQAVSTGLDLVVQRRRELQRDGLPLYRPWVFMLTDGAPTDDVGHVPASVSTLEQEKKVLFWSVATGDADPSILKTFTPEKPVLMLPDNQWQAMFEWVSAAMKSTSGSSPGQQITIDPWSYTT
jgi:uncharacterized protein YegL